MGENGRRRGRPRAFDERTALAAVLDTFWTKGFSATSLDDLAAATGLARPSLYAAFGDKRGMYLAALAQLEAELRDVLASCLSPERPLRDGLIAFFEASTTLYVSGPHPRGCLVVCTAPAEAVEDPAVRDALARVLAMLDAAFAARFAMEPDGPDADTRAMLASAILHSLAIRARAGQGPGKLEQLARAGVDALAPPATVGTNVDRP